VRGCEEKAEKATAHEDRVKFRWLDAYLRGRLLHTITRDEIQAMGKAKAKESSRPTANRYLALVRAVLRRAARPWQGIDKAPAVTLYPEAKRRVRWLNKEEVSRLLNALPPHQRQLALCARDRLEASQRASATVVVYRSCTPHGMGSCRSGQGRRGDRCAVERRSDAVLQEENGKHRERVFTFKGRPLGQVNTRSWRNALQRAGIKNFRWHDLRHVWATWHVMAGTTIAELQELGAWKSELMVKRYAHFAPEQLRSAATRLGTFLASSRNTSATAFATDSSLVTSSASIANDR
jgi:integrase